MRYESFACVREGQEARGHDRLEHGVIIPVMVQTNKRGMPNPRDEEGNVASGGTLGPSILAFDSVRSKSSGAPHFTPVFRYRTQWTLFVRSNKVGETHRAASQYLSIGRPPAIRMLFSIGHHRREPRTLREFISDLNLDTHTYRAVGETFRLFATNMYSPFC